MTVEEIIKAELNIPVLKEPDPLLPACATYIDYYIASELNGDGTGQEWVSSYEVDLWYVESCDPAAKLWRAIIKFEKMEGDICD